MTTLIATIVAVAYQLGVIQFADFISGQFLKKTNNGFKLQSQVSTEGGA
jgi:hypothetical protein